MILHWIGYGVLTVMLGFVVFKLLPSLIRLRRALRSARSRFGEKAKKRAAFHEAGHAVVYLLSGIELPQVRIGIRPYVSVERSLDGFPRIRVLFGGGDMGIPLLVNLDEMTSVIAVFLGGMVAEELFLGSISDGVSGDLEQAVRLVRDYVCLAPIQFLHEGSQVDFGNIVAAHVKGTSSDAAQARIEDKCSALLSTVYSDVKEKLSQQRPAVETIAQALLKKGKLRPDEITRIWQETRSGGG